MSHGGGHVGGGGHIGGHHGGFGGGDHHDQSGSFTPNVPVTGTKGGGVRRRDAVLVTAVVAVLALATIALFIVAAS
jgi:hypothetical protein